MRLPRDVNGDQAVRALGRLGFADVRHTGSHRILRKDGRTVVVPMHRPIKPGTLKGLIEQAGVTVEVFVTELWLSKEEWPWLEPVSSLVHPSGGP